MKPIVFSLILFGSAIVLLVGTAIIHRVTSVSNPPGGAVVLTESAPTTTAPVVPLFQSAAVIGSDPLQGLGPEWTFLRQESLREERVPWVDGVRVTRESLVKVVGEEVQLQISEGDILDSEALDRALRATTIFPMTIAGREGHLIPVADIQGSYAFALRGQRSMLFLEHPSLPRWEGSIAAEILNAIAALQLP